MWRAVYVLSTTIVGITKTSNGKTKLSIQDQIQVLQETIEWYEAQILPHDCGWMKTTISGIRNQN